MKKTCVIVHCWEGYPEYCWYPHTQKSLKKKGFKVIVPQMPDTNTPTLEKWLTKLQEVVPKPDENTYLIGHSLGCITILRYLESLTEKQKIGGAVFVAGFVDNLGFQEIGSFFETPIDFEKINQRCPNFVAIHSNNDPYVPLENGGIFKEKLGAQLIVKHLMGHFSGEIENEESCTELPDVIESVVEISNN